MGAWTNLNRDLDAYLGRHETDEDYLEIKPTLIKEAQLRIFREFPLDDFNVEINSTFVANRGFIERPASLIAVNYMSVSPSGSAYQPVIKQDVAWLQVAYPSRFATGVPRYWALQDETSIRVSPTPDDDYQYRLGIRRVRALLSVSTEDTQLSENWYMAILQAAVIEGARFANEDKRTAILEAAEGAYAQQLAAATGVQFGKTRSAAEGGPSQA